MTAEGQLGGPKFRGLPNTQPKSVPANWRRVTNPNSSFSWAARFSKEMTVPGLEKLVTFVSLPYVRIPFGTPERWLRRHHGGLHLDSLPWSRCRLSFSAIMSSKGKWFGRICNFPSNKPRAQLTASQNSCHNVRGTWSTCCQGAVGKKCSETCANAKDLGWKYQSMCQGVITTQLYIV